VTPSASARAADASAGPASDPTLVARIDAILPQTQCTKCGYPACRPYAEAIAADAAPINRCPPGGAEGIARLATLLGRPPIPLDPACGFEAPRRVAVIDETRCIGCTLCIQACPVDAIVGAPKLMHTVVTTLCSGCDLCLPPCPVDCITMQPATGADAVWDTPRQDAARARHAARARRLARASARDATPLPAPMPAAADALVGPDLREVADKRAVIEAALARARARRAGRGEPPR
jgi:electron transport complex protein RnfB